MKIGRCNFTKTMVVSVLPGTKSTRCNMVGKIILSHVPTSRASFLASSPSSVTATLADFYQYAREALDYSYARIGDGILPHYHTTLPHHTTITPKYQTTIPPHHHTITLPHYHTTTLPHHHPTHHYITIPPYYHTITLHTTALPHHHPTQ